MCADTVLFISMWFCWLQISYRVPYAVRVMYSAVSHQATVNCQRCHVEVYDFQDTQTMDAKQVICKMEVFKMDSCRAMRLIYLTINLVF